MNSEADEIFNRVCAELAENNDTSDPAQHPDVVAGDKAAWTAHGEFTKKVDEYNYKDKLE
jgi:hypothetical protein